MMADTEGDPWVIGSTVVIHVDTEHFFVGVAGPVEVKGYSKVWMRRWHHEEAHATTGVVSDHER